MIDLTVFQIFRAIPSNLDIDSSASSSPFVSLFPVHSPCAKFSPAGDSLWLRVPARPGETSTVAAHFMGHMGKTSKTWLISKNEFIHKTQDGTHNLVKFQGHRMVIVGLSEPA